MFYECLHLIIVMKYSVVLDVTLRPDTGSGAVLMRKRIDTVKDIVPLVFGEKISLAALNQRDCLNDVVFQVDGLKSRVVEDKGPPFPAGYSVQERTYHASAFITLDSKNLDSATLDLATSGFLLVSRK